MDDVALKSPASASLFEKANVELDNSRQFDGMVKLNLKPGKASISEYSKVTASLKESEQVKYVLPYFERGAGIEPIGTSDIFYLKLKNSGDIALLEKMAGELGVRVIEEIPYTPRWYVLSIIGSEFGNSIEASNYFYETGEFEDVDPAFMFDFKPSANDPDFYRQWGLQNTSSPNNDIDILPAWEISTGTGVKVAVVDHPIDSAHRELDGNIHSLSYNAKLKQTPSASYSGGDSHGTHVAGIIAAEKNGSQVTGVAYNSKIVRVSHDLLLTPTTSSELAAGINWAWKNSANGGAGVDVINCSWGDQGRQGYNLLKSSILESAIRDAMTQGRGGKGCVVVFPSGNYGHVNQGYVDYPGNFHDDILVVGAIESSGLRWNQSGYGTKLDVMAPGSSIWSTIPNNSIGSLTGTSMAAPHVAGIAALILSRHPNFTRQQVVDIIQSTAINYPNNRNDYFGYGLVNAHKAVFGDLVITGWDNQSRNVSTQYSVPTTLPVGVTYSGNWSISPMKGGNSYTVSGGISGATLNITFTAEDVYQITRQFRLPDGTIHIARKWVNTYRITSISHYPTYPTAGGYITFTAQGNTSGAQFEWTKMEGFANMNPSTIITHQNQYEALVSSNFGNGDRVVIACRAKWADEAAWSDYVYAYVYGPYSPAPAPMDDEEDTKDEALEITPNSTIRDVALL